MTRRHYYLFSLWLPLIVPSILYVLLNGRIAEFFPQGLLSVLMGLMFSVVLGGIQYFIFALLVLWRFHARDNASIRRLSWWLPVLYLPCFLLGLLAYEIFQSGWDFAVTDIMDFRSVFIAGICLGVGYGYVLFVHGLEFVLKKLKVVRD